MALSLHLSPTGFISQENTNTNLTAFFSFCSYSLPIIHHTSIITINLNKLISLFISPKDVRIKTTILNMAYKVLSMAHVSFSPLITLPLISKHILVNSSNQLLAFCQYLIMSMFFTSGPSHMRSLYLKYIFLFTSVMPNETIP